MSVVVSDRAKKELARLEVGGPRFLRISVVPGGCSGMTYDAAVDGTLTDEDETVYNDGDLRIVSDSGSAPFLDGLEIDYSDDLVRSGFQFRNAKAAKSCGCGASFQV